MELSTTELLYLPHCSRSPNLQFFNLNNFFSPCIISDLSWRLWKCTKTMPYLRLNTEWAVSDVNCLLGTSSRSHIQLLILHYRFAISSISLCAGTYMLPKSFPYWYICFRIKRKWLFSISDGEPTHGKWSSLYQFFGTSKKPVERSSATNFFPTRLYEGSLHKTITVVPALSVSVRVGFDRLLHKFYMLLWAI